MRHAFPPPPRVPDESKVQRAHEVENISTKTVFGIAPGDTGSVIVTDGQFNVLIKAGLVKVIAEPSDEAEPETEATVEEILHGYVVEASDHVTVDDNQEGE